MSNDTNDEVVFAEPEKRGGNNSLPPGTRLLNSYEIVSELGSGGFGIVYLAKDLASKVQVAIKEYFPRAIAGRAYATKKISAEKANDRASYQKGVDAFINEAGRLRQLTHPGVIRVHHAFEDMGNVYYAMALCEGASLQDKIDAGEIPTEEQASAWLVGILEALSYVHTNHLLHLDVSPTNVLIAPNNRPILIDFGAARDAVGQASQLLTVIARQGYTPYEQYDEYGLVVHTAATDLYALGATFYHLLSSVLPVSGLSRKIDGARNHLRPLATVAKAKYGPRLVESVEKAMQVEPKDRWQSADAWLAFLASDLQPKKSWLNRILIAVGIILILLWLIGTNSPSTQVPVDEIPPAPVAAPADPVAAVPELPTPPAPSVPEAPPPPVPSVPDISPPPANLLPDLPPPLVEPLPDLPPPPAIDDAATAVEAAAAAAAC